MKKIYNLVILLFLGISATKATPQLTSMSVRSTFLTSGKIKVYNSGILEILVDIGASRAMPTNGVYENVEMEVVFFMEIGGVHHELKTIALSSSDFDGFYLAYYEDPNIKNLVKVTIPQSLKNGTFRVKSRYKDGNGDWQPNYGSGYEVLQGVLYQTILINNWWEVLSPYPNATALQRLYSAHWGVHMLADTDEAYDIAHDWITSASTYAYAYESLLGYVQDTQEAGTVPLHRYFRSSNKDHYFTTGSITPAGYVYEGVQGYVYTAPATGLVPIYGYSPYSGPADHVYSKNYGELGGGNSHWRYEGIVFYVLQ